MEGTEAAETAADAGDSEADRGEVLVAEDRSEDLVAQDVRVDLVGADLEAQDPEGLTGTIEADPVVPISQLQDWLMIAKKTSIDNTKGVKLVTKS